MEVETITKKKSKAFPVVRFKEFEENWTINKIGSFVKERSVIAQKELPLYSLTIENGVVPKSKRYERSFLVKGKANAYKMMLPGDFAFNPMNLRFGALAKYKGKKEIAISKYYNIFYCIGNSNSAFMEYYLTRYNMIQYYNKMSTGTLEEKKRIHFSDFVNFKKLFPSLPEQEKIASFLSAVDKKIQHLTRKKALLENYKKGVMQKLFSQEIRFKDEDGKDFPEWEKKKLKDVCIVNPKNSELPETFIYIDLESVNSGRLVKENKISAIEAPSRAQRNLEKDDILFQTVRPYQKNNLFFDKKGDYIASTGYAQLRVRENPMFFYQLLHTEEFVTKVMKRCTGTSFPAINSNDLAKIRVKIPEVKEQQKIADFLSAIDRKIEAVLQQIEKTQTFKKGLLQQMFV